MEASFVGGGGKKPKESGVKFDAEIPSQIPAPLSADTRRRQCSHNTSYTTFP